MTRQTIIGITGGSGCGKTTALQALAELGVHIIDCDAVYHELLQTDAAMLCALDAAFPGVVEHGVLQRKMLGQQVFSDPDALDRLNRTVWPFINCTVEEIVKSHAPEPCAIDAFALVESGLDALCTHTVAVIAPEDARVRRLMLREGISGEYARLRIRAQKSNEVYAAQCGMTIENNDSHAAAFQARCRAIFQTILREDPT